MILAVIVFLIFYICIGVLIQFLVWDVREELGWYHCVVWLMWPALLLAIVFVLLKWLSEMIFDEW